MDLLEPAGLEPLWGAIDESRRGYSERFSIIYDICIHVRIRAGRLTQKKKKSIGGSSFLFHLLLGKIRDSMMK